MQVKLLNMVLWMKYFILQNTHTHGHCYLQYQILIQLINYYQFRVLHQICFIPPKGDAFADRNKYALEIDYLEQPPFFKVSNSHYAATWLLHPNAPKIEMPKIIGQRIEKYKDNTKEAKINNTAKVDIKDKK